MTYYSKTMEELDKYVAQLEFKVRSADVSAALLRPKEELVPNLTPGLNLNVPNYNNTIYIHQMAVLAGICL